MRECIWTIWDWILLCLIMWNKYVGGQQEGLSIKRGRRSRRRSRSCTGRQRHYMKKMILHKLKIRSFMIMRMILNWL